MKKLFVLLAMMLLCMSQGAWAGKVTEAEALQKARQFMQNRQFAKKATSLRRAPQREHATSAYYVFNAENDGGFVIVSGDDCVPDILGFSDHGSMDMDNLPDNLRWWLSKYERQIDYCAENDITAASPAQRGIGGQDVAPFITTRWSQWGPYNDLCPTSCPTGCVATAMAQIMNYYQWPKQGRGSSSYEWNGQTLSADYSNTTYDWNNMIDSYDSNSTSAQCSAVATLMYHCGVACEMGYDSYEAGGSGAFVVSAYKAFLAYFKYNANYAGNYSEKYTDEEWKNIIYTELAAGRPVFCSGSSINSAHAFVCDGYKNDNGDWFHFNWGWGGYEDGFFRLFAAEGTPYNQYDGNMNFIYNIVPENGDRMSFGYAAFNDATGTLTFSCGDKPSGTKVYEVFDAGWELFSNWETEWIDGNSNTIASDIKKVVFEPSYAKARPQSTNGWFNNCTNLTEIEGLEHLNTENVTDMGCMFYNCNSLTTLNVSGFNTENVTNMHSMFYSCNNLKTLDVSGFNTTNVTDMIWMFNNCNSLTTLNVSGFNTENVTSMFMMFYDCNSLTELDLSSFNTANVTNMSWMFSFCNSLNRIYIGDEWNTNNVTNSDHMFQRCTNLVGSDGTKYRYPNMDKTYAHAGTGGYLTYKDATVITAPTLDLTGKENYYTLDGRKVEGVPTQQGIYIVNRRKVIIKGKR